MRLNLIIFAFIALCCFYGGTSSLKAQDTPQTISEPFQSGFDPQRHIDIDEVTPGMRGYGLTVFSGDKIERFDVVAVSIMRNKGPKQDALLIKCDDERFSLAKGVQGVSGSPVFFKGKMAGAMSFGWQFSEEPLYGVTPIRQMLQVRQAGLAGNQKNSIPCENIISLDRGIFQDLMRETLLSKEYILKLAQKAGLAAPNPSSHARTSLPLTVSLGGFNTKAFEYLQQWIPQLNLLQAVAVDGPSSLNQVDSIKLQPGSALSIPLMMGDMKAAVLGTATEVIGNQVYGFGHAWNGNGASAWPMGTGKIHTFVSRKNMSFKLGEVTSLIGTICADEETAVYGETGKIPEMTDIHIRINWSGPGYQEDFSVKAARNEAITPLMAATAAMNALLQKGGLPWEHTIDYEISMDFDKSDSIRFKNISSNNDIFDILLDILEPVTLMMNNPWEKVTLTRLHMTATIHDKINYAVIKSSRLSQRILQPGQMLKAFVELEPIRGKTQEAGISLRIPDDLPDGKYKMNISSSSAYRKILQINQKHRFMAFNAGGVQRALQERLSIQRDRLYLSMILPRPGLAIENLPLPDLPASKTMLITNPSRKKVITPFSPLASSIVKTDFVVNGNVVFDIEIRK